MASVVRAIRVYADTSVYGGVFDRFFTQASRAFFDQVAAGRFELLTSAEVAFEIGPAPESVRQFFGMMRDRSTVVDVNAEAIELQAAYLRAGILGEASESDALHVALATVHRCSAIVSWNFKHIVHFQKIPLYNAVNATVGYGPIGIHSPAEVISYET